MIVRRDFQQMTPEHWEAKCGVPSASNFDRIITSKGKLSAQADKYIAELLSESVMQLPNYFTGQGHPIRRPFSNEHTENGMQLEHEARLAFEMDSGMKVEQVGWCLADDGRFGFSPDGLVIGHQAGLELKCPALHTQFQYLMKGTLPPDYKAQVHGALAISGYERYYFYAYATGAEPLMLVVTPDEYTEALKAALDAFWARYQDAKRRLLGGAA